MSRRTAAWVLAGALVVAAGGCGDDEPEARSSPTDPAAPHLRPPGTELADGLVVPDGARLAGDVFRQPPEDPAGSPSSSTTSTTVPAVLGDLPDGWSALLTVDGDPFTVFDDLAAQIRALGPALAGTADACTWLLEDEPDSSAPGQRVPVEDGPPEGTIAELRCGASAAVGPRLVEVILWWGGARPGSVLIDVRESPLDGPYSFGEASGMGEGTDPPPVPQPESVEPEARELLPEPPSPETPDPGDPFGGRANCFLTGYDRFRLPSGADLVATEGGWDGASVLATSDAVATMDALARTTVTGDDGTVGDLLPRRTVPGPDGGTILVDFLAPGAGSGACTVLSSPDGRYVLITMHSD